MRPIDSSTPIDSTPDVAPADLKPQTPNSSALSSSAADQTPEPSDPGAAASKRMERDLEAAYFKGVLGNAGPRWGTQVLYNKNVKPDTLVANETPVLASAPTRVADAGDDVNLEVRAGAGHLVGHKEVGRGECFDFADKVLRDAHSKSAADFQKITGKRDQDYKWGTPIDMKDAKPGDIIQFRDHHVNIETVTRITKTYPDGHKEKIVKKESESYNRAPQHTSVVLANQGDGKMTVAEQHVIDRDTGQRSHTVHKNDLYTQNSTKTTTTKRMEGDVKVEEEKTVTVTVTGKAWAYHPQPKDDKK